VRGELARGVGEISVTGQSFLDLERDKAQQGGVKDTRKHVRTLPTHLARSKSFFFSGGTGWENYGIEETEV
jgi:hypothetical protein